MAFTWSEAQQQVIDLRERSLLVSAAAGSGKTAVLVERILKMITDPLKPVDIDRLLVVTFTKAAAAEMRDRLRTALENRISSEEDQVLTVRLKKQLLLLRDAKICTIDAFCASVVRNHFYALDIDPAFRIGDSGEMELLKNDVLSDLLESEYEQGNEAFLDFTETFASGKNDSGVEELIRDLFRLSESAPWPDFWLDHCIDGYNLSEEDGIDAAAWGRFFTESLKMKAEDLAAELMALTEEVRAEGADAEFMLPLLRKEGEMLCDAAAALNYEMLIERINGMNFERFPLLPKTAKGDETLDTYRKFVMERRNEIKDKARKELRYGKLPSAKETAALLSEMQPHVSELVRLTKAFAEKYSTEKRRRNLCDYPDLEHFTLSLFLDENRERTEIAKMYAEQFEEILIDEYQDANLIQDTIFRAISREADGQPNMFMVGDVKQSIYGFRMADPTLFIDKYDRYTDTDSDHRKIELVLNFRSRAEILENVNFFFFALMRRAVGGIDYTESSALHGGFNPEVPEGVLFGGGTEIDLIETDAADDESEAEDDALTALTKIETEALFTVRKIRKLLSEAPERQVYDTKAGALRPIRYSDITVLFRVKKNWMATYADTLSRAGIPVYTDEGGGYFDTREVTLILDLLRVIDNPMQDIPLIAVLHSPLFNFSAEMLSRLRLAHLKEEDDTDLGFYGALRADESEASKTFLSKISEWRKKAARMDLSAFLRYLYDETGIVSYFSAAKGGAEKKANLEMLIEKAAAFEKSSYRGIFRFIRYIEKLKKYSASDAAEAHSAEDQGDAVRLMTIHGSKGMEFPVVILAGISKHFNQSDLKKKLLMDTTLGIGTDYINASRRIKADCLIKDALKEKKKTELLGEELRVLYVAMTRAREKLIFTGTVRNFTDIRDRYEALWTKPPAKLSGTRILSATGYLEWLLEAYRTDSHIALNVIPKAELISESQDSENASRNTDIFEKLVSETEMTEEVVSGMRKFDEKMDGVRLYDDLYRVGPTVSVSALKAKLYEAEGGEQKTQVLVNDIPKAPEGAITGAERGTLYHLVMEKAVPGENIEEALAGLEKQGLISAKEKATIDTNKIGRFFASDIGRRFTKANAEGRGFREKPFIIGCPVRTIFPEIRTVRSEDERVMIQGIIDMYFEEADGFVVVDYKTDRVREAQTLADRYRIQLDLYAEALETITGKKVKEKWIWSFELDRSVRL